MNNDLDKQKALRALNKYEEGAVNQPKQRKVVARRFSPKKLLINVGVPALLVGVAIGGLYMGTGDLEASKAMAHGEEPEPNAIEQQMNQEAVARAEEAAYGANSLRGSVQVVANSYNDTINLMLSTIKKDSLVKDTDEEESIQEFKDNYAGFKKDYIETNIDFSKMSENQRLMYAHDLNMQKETLIAQQIAELDDQKGQYDQKSFDYANIIKKIEDLKAEMTNVKGINTVVINEMMKIGMISSDTKESGISK